MEVHAQVRRALNTYVHAALGLLEKTVSQVRICEEGFVRYICNTCFATGKQSASLM